MAEFINTVDVLGDDVVVDSIIQRTITEFKDNLVTAFAESTFRDCSALEVLELPSVTALPGLYSSDLFRGCSSLKRLCFPKVSEIFTNKFRGISSLEYVDLTAIKRINAYSMCGTNLQALVIRNVSQVVGLADVSAFVYMTNSSGIARGTGYIYVPRDLVDSYKAATNWSTYAAQIRALEDYTVDGTITGELDETRI